MPKFSIQQRAATGSTVGADGRQDCPGHDSQGQKFSHHPHDQAHPVGYIELAVQTIEVGVNSVLRDT